MLDRRTRLATAIQIAVLALSLLLPAMVLRGDLRMTRDLDSALEAVHLDETRGDEALVELADWLRWYDEGADRPEKQLANGLTRPLRRGPVRGRVCARGQDVRTRIDEALVGQLRASRSHLRTVGRSWSREQLQQFQVALSTERAASAWVAMLQGNTLAPLETEFLAKQAFPEHPALVGTGLLQIARRCVQPDPSDVQTELGRLSEARAALPAADQALASTLALLLSRTQGQLELIADTRFRPTVWQTDPSRTDQPLDDWRNSEGLAPFTEANERALAEVRDTRHSTPHADLRDGYQRLHEVQWLHWLDAIRLRADVTPPEVRDVLEDITALTRVVGRGPPAASDGSGNPLPQTCGGWAWRAAAMLTPGSAHLTPLSDAGTKLDALMRGSTMALDEQVDLQLSTGQSVFSAYYEARLLDVERLSQGDRPDECTLEDRTRDVVYKVDEIVTDHVAMLWANSLKERIERFNEDYKRRIRQPFYQQSLDKRYPVAASATGSASVSDVKALFGCGSGEDPTRPALQEWLSAHHTLLDRDHGTGPPLVPWRGAVIPKIPHAKLLRRHGGLCDQFDAIDSTASVGVELLDRPRPKSVTTIQLLVGGTTQIPLRYAPGDRLGSKQILSDTQLTTSVSISTKSICHQTRDSPWSFLRDFADAKGESYRTFDCGNGAVALRITDQSEPRRQELLAHMRAVAEVLESQVLATVTAATVR